MTFRLAKAVSVIFITPVIGCSLLIPIDNVSGGADPDASLADGASAEGASGDGGDGGAPVSDAGSDVASDAALPNLQPNGGFEIVNGNECGSEWGVFQGTGTRVSDARTGAYACKACGTSTTDKNYSLNDGDSTNILVKPGERYVVEAWVRALDSAGTTQHVRGVIRIYAAGSTTQVVQRVDPPVAALTTTWTRIETTLDITVEGRFNYYISFNDGALGSCALVDDVVIHRL